MAKKHISLWIDEDILKKSDANIKIAEEQKRVHRSGDRLL